MILKNNMKPDVVILEMDEEIETILSISKKIFSRPLTEEECKIILQTIVSLHFDFNDNSEELDDTLFHAANFFEALEYNLSGDNDTGKQNKVEQEQLYEPF